MYCNEASLVTADNICFVMLNVMCILEHSLIKISIAKNAFETHFSS